MGVFSVVGSCSWLLEAQDRTLVHRRDLPASGLQVPDYGHGAPLALDPSSDAKRYTHCSCRICLS